MARTRRAPLDPSGLPPEIAAGPTHPAWGGSGDPDDRDARAKWHAAGHEWSLEVLGNVNGWMNLLPSDVKRQQSARERYRRMMARNAH